MLHWCHRVTAFDWHSHHRSAHNFFLTRSLLLLPSPRHSAAALSLSQSPLPPTSLHYSIMELTLNGLVKMLGMQGESPQQAPTQRQFVPTASLLEQDYTVLDMLNSPGHEQVSFCICDPNQTDCPIIFASDGFCLETGYAPDEIQGRNCRFLQGQDTNPDDVNRIRKAIKEEKNVSVNLLNYRKDGSSFCNEFFLAPLRRSNDDSKIAYYIGVQCKVPKLGAGQAPSNPGWVYTQCLHA